MKHLANIVRKEIRELITPGTLVSIIAMSVLFAAIGAMVGSEIEKSVKPPEFAIANLDPLEGGNAEHSAGAMNDFESWYEGFFGVGTGDKVTILDGGDLAILDGGDVDERLALMERIGKDCLIVIPKNFSENIDGSGMGVIETFWIQSETGMMSDLSSAMLSPVMTYLSDFATESYLVSKGLGPEDAKHSINLVYAGRDSTYLQGKLHEGVSPSEISAAASSQTLFIPLVVMLIVVMIGSVLIASIGSEKENKTLETLLTMPISRTTVVFGKILGSAVAGLVFGGIYMGGMVFYMQGLTKFGTGTVSLESLGLSLGLAEWALVFVFVFLSIFCALGLCIILGAFAKNYKSAQIYVMPISIMAIIPMMITMFSSFGSLPVALQALVFAIPFSHPMMVLENLMFDNTAILAGGLVYMLAFSVATIMIAVRLYKSDILLTGLVRKKGGPAFAFKLGRGDGRP
ncbi:MAG: ABC transporter permease [Thermoplasmatales archaeon]|nr:ABC transporter permease [Thermoplasmatales archaeon]